MSELKNKIVWITGASSGIGEATAYALAKEGSKLVLSARRKDELEKVKQNCGVPDEDVLVLPLDIEDLEQINVATKTVIAKFGKIDVLINNAGISQRGDVLTTSMEVYQRIININLLGVIALTKAVLPGMINKNSGHIVVTSSVSGKLGTPLRSGYSASKHALHGFFDSLRAEVFRNNIQVTLVCPGYINTDISLNALSSDGSKHGKMDSNQQNGVPADICAQKIVAGIRNNKSEIYIGGKEVLGVYLKRFFPKILEKIVLKQAPK